MRVKTINRINCINRNCTAQCRIHNFIGNARVQRYNWICAQLVNHLHCMQPIEGERKDYVNARDEANFGQEANRFRSVVGLRKRIDMRFVNFSFEFLFEFHSLINSKQSEALLILGNYKYFRIRWSFKGKKLIVVPSQPISFCRIQKSAWTLLIIFIVSPN